MIGTSAKAGLFWRVAETVGSEGVSFAVFALLARVLAPSEFGAVAIAIALMGVLQVSLYHGWIEALVTGHQPEDRDGFRLAGTLAFVYALLLAAVAALAAVPIGTLLHRPEFAPMLWALLPTLPLRALATSMLAELRLQMRFRATALRTLAGVFVGGLIALAAAHAGAGRWALVVQQWTAELAGFCVLAWATRRALLTTRLGGEAVRPLLARVWPVMVSQVLSQSLRRLDLIILGVFLPDHDVGILFLVNRLIYAAQMVTQHAMSDVALVVLSRSGIALGKGPTTLREVNAIGTATGCIAFVALAVLGAELIPAVFGAKWADAIAPVSVSALGAMFGATTAMIATTMLAANNEGRFATLNAVAAGLRIVLCVIGAHWGLMGVAIAAAVSGIVTVVPFLMAQARLAGERLRSIADRSLAELLGCSLLIGAWWMVRPAGFDVRIALGLSVAAVAAVLLFFQLRTSMRHLAAAAAAVPSP